MKISLLVIVLTCILFSQCKKAESTENSTNTAEFFTYTLDGANFSFSLPSDTFTVTTQVIFGTPLTSMYISCFNKLPPGVGYIILTTKQTNLVVGTYPSALPCDVNGLNIPENSLQIVQTSFAHSIGEYFEGTFSGVFSDAGSQHNINGAFKVKRNY